MIDLPSTQALPITPRFGKTDLGSATAFVVLSSAKGPLLITNWHVVTGRNSETKIPVRADSGIPDNLVVRFNKKNCLGVFVEQVVPIYDGHGDPLWFEHPVHGSAVDVVALPFQSNDEVDLHPLNYTTEVGHDVLPEPIKWGASDAVFVLGFPFGYKGSGDLAIWSQGIIASEPDLDFRSCPRFLIDSRTRPGQSGAPVLFYRRGGGFIQLASGKAYMLHNSRTILLGVYSGRLNENSDLGTVWKSSSIAEIAEHGNIGALI